MATPKKTQEQWRDAGDGRFLSKQQAAQKPANQVVKERNPVPTKKK